MIPLEDVRFSNIQILNEGKGGGTMKIRGVFQRAEDPNQNNRVYPRTVLENSMKKLKPLMESRQLLGELDHPAEGVVSLRNSSHLITNLYWNGNDVIGEAEVLNTPAGLIAQALIRDGVKVGISSRGTGTLSEGNSGFKTVNEDYNMITFDLVADPSTKGAFPSLAESRKLGEEFISKYGPKVLASSIMKDLVKSKLNESSRANEKRAQRRIKILRPNIKESKTQTPPKKVVKLRKFDS